MEELMPVGSLSWNELVTNDVEGAKLFYGRVLGWKYVESVMSDGTIYTMAQTVNGPVGGIFAAPRELSLAPHWSPYAVVMDADKAARTVVELGGTLVFPVMDAPNIGRFCVARDPQGAMFTLIAYG